MVASAVLEDGDRRCGEYEVRSAGRRHYDGVAPQRRVPSRRKPGWGISNGVEEWRSWGERRRKRLEKAKNGAARGLIRTTDPSDQGRYVEGDGGSAVGGRRRRTLAASGLIQTVICSAVWARETGLMDSLLILWEVKVIR